MSERRRLTAVDAAATAGASRLPGRDGGFAAAAINAVRPAQKILGRFQAVSRSSSICSCSSWLNWYRGRI